MQMLETNEWYFAHPSAWEDPYEVRVTNALSNAMFAQCWCRRGVSDAMWRIYSPDKLGVRIRTTESKLKSALLALATKREVGFRIARVKYENEISHMLRDQQQLLEAAKKVTFVRASSHLFLKRLAFEHEAETRVLIFDASQPIDSTAKGLLVELNTRHLIDSVLVDPRAPDEFVAAYQHYLTDVLKFSGPVKKSQLYRSDQKIES